MPERVLELAQAATTRDSIGRLTILLQDIEKQKQEAEVLLAKAQESEEKNAKVEEEIRRFEAWAENVRPLITDKSYEPTYEEKRMAVRILGIQAVIHPKPGKHDIEILCAPPKIMRLLLQFQPSVGRTAQ